MLVELVVLPVGVAGEGPHGEHVSVRGVGDATGAIEDPGDALLGPVSRGELWGEIGGKRVKHGLKLCA